MSDTTLSLIARTGLDQDRAEALLKRGLEGADDGELFLEYRQAEALVFDNGRLKQATYDTAQGFGLRAVKGETCEDDTSPPVSLRPRLCPLPPEKTANHGTADTTWAQA